MSLYNFVTDNFKEYDFDTEYCLNRRRRRRILYWPIKDPQGA